jgi:hypothetical protein
MRLDAVGAFVDRQDARIAQVLGSAGLLDEAHAAVDLHAERGDSMATFGAPALHDRRQQVDRAPVERCARRRRANVACGPGCRARRQMRAPGLGQRLHLQQHAPHVRVVDDRGGRPGCPGTEPCTRSRA